MLRGLKPIRFRSLKTNRDLDVRSGRRVREKTREELDEEYAKLPCCNSPQTSDPCRFQKKLEEGFRCIGVRGLKIDCPHLGSVRPRKSVVDKAKEKERALEQIVEAPPKIVV